LFFVELFFYFLFYFKDMAFDAGKNSRNEILSFFVFFLLKFHVFKFSSKCKILNFFEKLYYFSFSARQFAQALVLCAFSRMG